MTFGLGSFFGVMGFLAFPLCFAYRMTTIYGHEKSENRPLTHAEADEYLFGKLGEDYCDWCPLEKVAAGECRCDTVETMWFLCRLLGRSKP